jgi:hypothetical protein
MKTKYLTLSEQIILGSIDLDGYDVSANTDLEKINEVYDIFKSERYHEIKRKGERKAFEEWLQGLPSALSVPCYYHEILGRAYLHGEINATATEEQEDAYLKQYWAKLTKAFFTLKENL